jgi:hypothetical protein
MADDDPRESAQLAVEFSCVPDLVELETGVGAAVVEDRLLHLRRHPVARRGDHKAPRIEWPRSGDERVDDVPQVGQPEVLDPPGLEDMPVAGRLPGDYIDPLLLLSAEAIRSDLKGLLDLLDYLQYQLFEPLPRQLAQWQQRKLRIDYKGKGISRANSGFPARPLLSRHGVFARNNPTVARRTDIPMPQLDRNSGSAASTAASNGVLSCWDARAWRFS